MTFDYTMLAETSGHNFIIVIITISRTTTLERRAHAYGMEISSEKSKIMVNSRIVPRTTILMNRSSPLRMTPPRKYTHTGKPGNISDSKTQEDMKQHQNGNKDTSL